MSKEPSVKHPFFSLDDVDEAIKRSQRGKTDTTAKTSGAPAAVISKSDTKKIITEEIKRPQQRLGAVSVADILGFNLDEPDPLPKRLEDEKVPKKFLSYYRQLIELREHVLGGLAFHTQETLNRSSKDDSGDLSGYSQHMADAGTETFDRDFALSLVSSEKEALHEIDKAIERIMNGTYGVCQINGKPISKERLKAVPFTRFSVEGQVEFEKTQKRTVQRGGAFAETVEESAAFSGEDDGED
jgi:RNA polymerase-binding transcription factor DksA